MYQGLLLRQLEFAQVIWVQTRTQVFSVDAYVSEGRLGFKGHVLHHLGVLDAFGMGFD